MKNTFPLKSVHKCGLWSERWSFLDFFGATTLLHKIKRISERTLEKTGRHGTYFFSILSRSEVRIGSFHFISTRKSDFWHWPLPIWLKFGIYTLLGHTIWRIFCFCKISIRLRIIVIQSWDFYEKFMKSGNI